MSETSGNFQFVPVGRAGQPKNANDRKTIRKAAMLAFRRQERTERVKAFAAECAAEAEAKASALPHTPPHSTKTLTRTRESTPSGPLVVAAKPVLDPPAITLRQDIKLDGSAMFIPYLSRNLSYLPGLSSGDTPDTAYVFDYFIFEIVPMMLPFDGHNQRVIRLFFSKNLMRDSVILQAALSHAAVQIDIVNNREPSKLAVMLTKEAIRLINERLAVKPFVVDNELIGAVALVACNSNLTGDLAESQIHMNALKEMIRMKGGRDNLGDDSFIRTLLSWADVTSSNLTLSEPRFAIESLDKTATKHTTPNVPPFDIYEVFGLIEELRQLTVLKNTIHSSEISTVQEIMDFDAQRNTLEGRVLALQYRFSTTRGLGFGEIFLDACCIAASIYMCLAFRNFKPNFPNLRTSKQDLMAAILKAEALYASLPNLPDSDFPYAEKLLWVLFIGGILASDESETIWFANRLTMVVPWTQVRSWTEADACLRSVLWIDKLHNDACKSLWNEVESMLGFKPSKIEAMDDDLVDFTLPLDPMLFP